MFEENVLLPRLRRRSDPRSSRARQLLVGHRVDSLEGGAHALVGNLDARLRRLVVGFAVIVHQYVRATEDTVLLIPADPGNVAPLRAALMGLGGRVRDTGEPPTERELDEAAHAARNNRGNGRPHP